MVRIDPRRGRNTLTIVVKEKITVALVKVHLRTRVIDRVIISINRYLAVLGYDSLTAERVFNRSCSYIQLTFSVKPQLGRYFLVSRSEEFASLLGKSSNIINIWIEVFDDFFFFVGIKAWVTVVFACLSVAAKVFKPAFELVREKLLVGKRNTIGKNRCSVECNRIFVQLNKDIIDRKSRLFPRNQASFSLKAVLHEVKPAFCSIYGIGIGNRSVSKVGFRIDFGIHTSHTIVAKDVSARISHAPMNSFRQIEMSSVQKIVSRYHSSIVYLQIVFGYVLLHSFEPLIVTLGTLI